MVNHRVAVVGAGLGGLRVAEQLRAAGHGGPITVIGAEPHMPYNRPPLSKELLAHELADAEAAPESDADDLAALHERVAFRRRASVADVTFRLGTAVTATDLSAGTLTLADGDTVSFDGLVAATGLRPRRLSVPGPEGPGSGRHVLRTLDDCASLRAELRAALRGTAAETVPASAAGSASVPGAQSSRGAANDAFPRPRVVVVGGGFVGCEVACTARSLGCDVTVVEPAGPPMLRVLGPDLAKAIQEAHERDGISFVIGQAVVAYTGEDRVTGVVLADGADAGVAGLNSARVPGGPESGGLARAGAVLPADLVVEAIGSVPNTEWLAGNGLDLTDGVLCDNGLTAVTGAHPGAVACAVGDVARFPNARFDDVPRRVEHWSMPMDTARRAAATLHAKLEGEAGDQNPFGPLPSFWSDQGELRLQSFGSPELGGDTEIEGDLRDLVQGLLATYRRAGRLVGGVLVNLPPMRHRELREALLHQ
jgi:3-phenylpropionate/trans-cinnamate dioxygenase ferredoxin reductase subunit